MPRTIISAIKTTMHALYILLNLRHDKNNATSVSEIATVKITCQSVVKQFVKKHSAIITADKIV